ncbi:MAG: hypothetical protein ACJ74H_09440 [Thermoanaerobaculia bacterium]
MLDALLARHLGIQLLRIGAAAFLLLLLIALGATILQRCRMQITDRRERIILCAACGFAAYQFVFRWLAELPIVGPLGAGAIVAGLAALSLPGWRTLRDDLRDFTLPHDWWSIAILLLLLAPLTMALAPAVSRDALVYHLRFPEMTLRLGTWAYDPASSTSFNPAAAGTLYVPALAADANGAIAQLVHFGFFVLCIVAAAAIARRLGAPTGKAAALLVASLPVAAIAGGWAWADLAYVFALAASALALLIGAPALTLVLLGLAVSVKYTALIAGLPLLVAAMAMFIRARAFRMLVLGCVLGALVVSPWLVTNFIRTGDPIYPLASKGHPAASVASTWSGQSWIDVWSAYFFQPRTLDEDAGGVLFLVIAAIGIGAAFARRELRMPAAFALAMWLVHLPLTAAMRLLLPALVTTLVVAGTALESRRWAAALMALFALRGGLVTAAHNAHFLNPLPAAAGIESEADYVRRNVSAAALFERADTMLPRDARVLAINEVRLFRFPRPVSASRIVDPPLIRRYVAGAANPQEVIARLRADGFTHVLVATRPVERGAGIRLTRDEETLMTATLRTCKVLDRQGNTMLLELPTSSSSR